MLLLAPSARMARRAPSCQTPSAGSVKPGQLTLAETLQKVFSGFLSNQFSNAVSILTITTGKGFYSSCPLHILPSNGRMLLPLIQNCSNITVVCFRIMLAQQVTTWGKCLEQTSAGKASGHSRED